ncbi:hypothetical protein [Leptodesmis sp.]|uniref:hypothetical protein n=1 Tax=Leptodesmis sp. TaxID=3100501 RepID=UPI0040534737
MSETDGNKPIEAAAYAAGGAVVGGVASSMIGGMGLAGGFGAIAIGAAPVVAAGAVTGLALKTVLDSWKSPSPGKQDVTQAISDRLKANLEEVRHQELIKAQAERDAF